MMRNQGYSVIEYSNAGSESEASEHVEILSNQEFYDLYGSRKAQDFFGDLAVIESRGHRLFESKLVNELKQRVKPKDIICHPFGQAHNTLLDVFSDNLHVETGIGYPTTMSRAFHVYESYAWCHYHQGKENRNGTNYEWVIPNYFDISDWKPRYEEGKYLAFLGRICSLKGLDTIKELAKHSPWPIYLCGQGDPSPWEHPNIKYLGPIVGEERSDFLRHARASLMPTIFTEPFGGSGVEGLLCGTPLISVHYGAFSETVQHGVNGFHCHTLQDWIDAVHEASELDRKTIATEARRKYSLESCGLKYDKVFTDLYHLYDKGWYTLR
jgi:glycosyltransferase involved in cell wall biosynthesis